MIPEQLELAAAHQARDAILERLDARAPEAWKAEARGAVLQTGRARVDFIADDVWAYLARPPQPKALGPILMAMARAGEIVPTGELRAHPKRHATKTQVWRLA